MRERPCGCCAAVDAQVLRLFAPVIEQARQILEADSVGGNVQECVLRWLASLGRQYPYSPQAQPSLIMAYPSLSLRHMSRLPTAVRC